MPEWNQNLTWRLDSSSSYLSGFHDLDNQRRMPGKGETMEELHVGRKVYTTIMGRHFLSPENRQGYNDCKDCSPAHAILRVIYNMQHDIPNQE